MNDPQFVPLTMTADRWQSTWQGSAYYELRCECEAQAREAASLRQRLEERISELQSVRHACLCSSEAREYALSNEREVEALRQELGQVRRDIEEYKQRDEAILRQHEAAVAESQRLNGEFKEQS